MTKRRGRGDGGLHWDQARQRWIATASLGYGADGKRIVKRGSGTTKTAAKAKLTEVLRDYEDGLAIAPSSYTVANAVTDWLSYGSTDEIKQPSLLARSSPTHTSPPVWVLGNSAISTRKMSRNG